jgi:hypothetical protein
LDKKNYKISGKIRIRFFNVKISVKDNFSSKEREVSAYSVKQAKILFANKFAKKMTCGVHLLDLEQAAIMEVEEKNKTSKFTTKEV